jgi:hypothetical protein
MIRDSILCCRRAVRRDSTSILAMYSTSTGASRASLAHTPSSLLFQRTVLAAEQPPSTALDRPGQGPCFAGQAVNPAGAPNKPVYEPKSAGQRFTGCRETRTRKDSAGRLSTTSVMCDGE